MLTDCPHCYKPMHEEAEFCPHCTGYVPNASMSSGVGSGSGEALIEFAFYAGVGFFVLGGTLDYLNWWHDWEMIPCILGAIVLALLWMRIMRTPDRASARRQAKYDREEAVMKPLREKRFEHLRHHPSNEPDWRELSQAQREGLTAKWEMELAEIDREIARHPRPSLR